MLRQIAAADEVVRCHQIERLAADDPCVAQFTTAKQHQAEAVIIAQRRGKPAATRVETALLRPAAARAFVEALHLVLGVKGIGVGQAVLLVGGHPEPGVDHAERAKDALLQHLCERLTLDPLDHRAEHVGRHRIIPVRAGVELQRDFREVGDKAVHRVIGIEIVDPRLAISRVDRGALLKAIGQSRRMAQQIDHADRRRGRSRQEGDIAAARDEDAGVLELGAELHQRIGQRDLALLDQHHEGDAGDRLGHARDAKDRVVLQRLAGPRVADARAMRDLAAPRYERRGVRQAAGVDIFGGEKGGDAVEPRRVESVGHAALPISARSGQATGASPGANW